MTDYGPGRAVFSADRKHRYTLKRYLNEVGGTQRAVFLMLNPSTADAFVLDPTVRRCVVFTRRWGCGELDVVNLFSLRSPYPEVLYRSPAEDRGADKENDNAILATCLGAHIVIAAWGNHGDDRKLCQRGQAVRAKLEDARVPLFHLGLSKTGSPLHPLARGKSMIPYEREPVRWTP